MRKPAPAAAGRRRATALISGLALCLALAGIGVFGLLHAPAQPQDGAPATRRPTALAVPGQSSRPIPLDPTSDPQRFAREVAAALSNWDTADAGQPADYMQPLIDAADPDGQDAAGLISDLAHYYPTAAQWAQLAEYGTRQSIDIHSVRVPSAWPHALKEAHGTLPPGAAAYTVTGARHRSGIWEGRPAADASPVAFTVFEACPPAPGACSLLRLSRPDDPLR